MRLSSLSNGGSGPSVPAAGFDVGQTRNRDALLSSQVPWFPAGPAGSGARKAAAGASGASASPGTSIGMSSTTGSSSGSPAVPRSQYPMPSKTPTGDVSWDDMASSSVASQAASVTVGVGSEGSSLQVNSTLLAVERQTPGVRARPEIPDDRDGRQVQEELGSNSSLSSPRTLDTDRVLSPIPEAVTAEDGAPDSIRTLGADGATGALAHQVVHASQEPQLSKNSMTAPTLSSSTSTLQLQHGPDDEQDALTRAFIESESMAAAQVRSGERRSPRTTNIWKVSRSVSPRGRSPPKRGVGINFEQRAPSGSPAPRSRAAKAAYIPASATSSSTPSHRAPIKGSSGSGDKLEVQMRRAPRAPNGIPGSPAGSQGTNVDVPVDEGLLTSHLRFAEYRSMFAARASPPPSSDTSKLQRSLVAGEEARRQEAGVGKSSAAASTSSAVPQVSLAHQKFRTYRALFPGSPNGGLKENNATSGKTEAAPRESGTLLGRGASREHLKGHKTVADYRRISADAERQVARALYRASD